MNDFEVVVVGAGVSGLRCARLLADGGRRVVVVEARDRPGGRTWTVPLADQWVDAGGSFIHDVDINPVLAYLEAEELGAVSAGPWGMGLGVADSSGWAATYEASAVVAAAGDFDPAEAAAALGPDEDRWSAGVDWYVADRGLTGRSSELVRSSLLWHLGGLNIGAHPDGVSLRGSAAYLDGGANAVPVGGYRELVGRLSSGLDIRLGAPVTGLTHRAGVVVSTASGDLSGDVAVVTVPLGVLRASILKFDPPLPPGQVAAMSRLGVAGLEKVALAFDARWWPEGMSRLARLSPDRTFTAWYDAGGPDGGSVLIGFHNPHLSDPPSVETGVGDRIALALASLEKVFDDVPAPVATMATDWWADPWSGGSYSYIPVGASPEDMRELARPASPFLVLAGEHTVPSAFGTVHAAFISGERAAGWALSRLG